MAAKQHDNQKKKRLANAALLALEMELWSRVCRQSLDTRKDEDVCSPLEFL